MKDNVTEEMLMAFLYGEISGDERKMVEEYLKKNPSKQQELESFGTLRTVMGQLKDVENIEVPSFEFSRTSDTAPLKQWKRLAVAASIALFVALGWISYRDIVDKNTADAQLVISQEQLQQLLEHQEKMAKQNAHLLKKIASLEIRISSVSEEQQENEMRLASLSKQKESGNNDVEAYLVALNQQNKQLFDQYFQTMTLQQQQYMETVLTDFNNYITQQRNHDILMLQTRITNLEQNTGEFQNVTAQLMASLTNNQVEYNNY